MAQNLICKSLKNEKQIRLFDLLSTKMVGFYFDAGWCLPGNEFLLKLNNVYTETKEKSINFELVYVSCDKDQKACLEVFNQKHGDWYMFPYDKNLME